MPSLNIDFEIFEGKSFRDLCKDIVNRSQTKKDQLDVLCSSVRELIKDKDSALLLIPRIKELLDVGVKNDEQLIKLAGVLQKLQSTQLETNGGDGILTDEDKEQILKITLKEDGNINSELTKVKKDIEDSISNLK